MQGFIQSAPHKGEFVPYQVVLTIETEADAIFLYDRFLSELPLAVLASEVLNTIDSGKKAGKH